MTNAQPVFAPTGGHWVNGGAGGAGTEAADETAESLEEAWAAGIDSVVSGSWPGLVTGGEQAAATPVVATNAAAILVRQARAFMAVASLSVLRAPPPEHCGH